MPTRHSEKVTISQFLQVFLTKAMKCGLDIEGDPDGRWFSVQNVKTGEPFDVRSTKVMVRFPEGSNDPIILVPENLDVKKHGHICPHFIAEKTYISGWKPLCPHMFQDINDEMLQFTVCLLGYMAKPCLCGLMGCEGKNLSRSGSQSVKEQGVISEDLVV